MEFDDLSAQPDGWSNDGAWILFSKVDPGTKWDIYRAPGSGSGALEPVVKGSGIEVGAEESPTGGWIGFLSDETGRLDIFVQSLAPSGPKLQVSTGGVQQRGWWTADGKHILFMKGDRTMWRVLPRVRERGPGIGCRSVRGPSAGSVIVARRSGTPPSRRTRRSSGRRGKPVVHRIAWVVLLGLLGSTAGGQEPTRPPVIDVHVHSTNTSPQDALARMSR